MCPLCFSGIKFVLCDVDSATLCLLPALKGLTQFYSESTEQSNFPKSKHCDLWNQGSKLFKFSSHPRILIKMSLTERLKVGTICSHLYFDCLLLVEVEAFSWQLRVLLAPYCLLVLTNI